MEFTNNAFEVMAAKYPQPISFYKEFLNIQSKNKELVQTLHTRANFLEVNSEQKKAYKTIINLLSDRQQHTIVVSGPAGVGKSKVASLIAHYAHKNIKMKYIATAHLAVAAAALNGSSLYSVLGIYQQRTIIEKIPDLHINFSTRQRLKGVKLLILDEASLIGD